MFYGEATRIIMTGELNALLRLHTLPINHLVLMVPSGGLCPGRSHLEARFPLRCFQRLSLPNIATRQCHWRDNRNTRDSSTPVLSYSEQRSETRSVGKECVCTGRSRGAP